MRYDSDDLLEAKKQILSIQHKVTEALKSIKDKNDPLRYRSQITLSERRLRAFEIALDLIERELSGSDSD